MNTSIPYRATTPWNDDPRAIKRRCRAFTLIELLVVFIIISILSSLMLAGLAGARQRAKTDKTKSTIRKIDSVIRPMFDSYRTRRVALTSPSLTDRKSNALSLLKAKRSLMVREMPDSWDDVPENAQAFNNLADSGGTDLRTAPVRAYTITRIANSSNPNYSLSLLKNYGSSECLFMIVTRSGFEPDALEMFRTDEVGDIDKDGENEFLDGWGRPIAFLRWAPGKTDSFVQVNDSDLAHDPMDPLRQDSTAFALVPLIFSAGPDESTNAPDDSAADGYGLARVASWSALNLSDLSKICDIYNEDNQKPGAPKVGNTSAYQDNITNHDLLKK